MVLEILWLFSLQWSLGLATYSQPIPEKINKDLCSRQPYLLNDCNWCTCTPQHTYRCSARECDGVDMFAHFNEAIQPLNIGMDGRGVWRQTDKIICEPNARFTKDDVVCVCNEEGTWPNPICDQLFSLLYNVQLTGLAVPANITKCEPNKIYLIGCNACICPKTGFINPEHCTNKSCTINDPALVANKGDKVEANATRRSISEFKHFYIECNPDQHYKLGCRSCTCTNDNSLVCGDCYTEKQLKKTKTVCFGHHKYIFADKCNICYCGDGNFAFCTVKKCLGEREAATVESKISSPGTLSIDSVDPPINDKDCIIGTIYKKDCNVCYCLEYKGVKIIDCRMGDCNDDANPLKSITASCVPNTYYELNCLVCHCVEVEKETWQRCAVKKECYLENLPAAEQRVVTSGPGKEISSSNKNKKQSGIQMDVIRMVNTGGLKCDTKTWYKIDCNFCMCLENGNTLCTFFNCK